MTSHVALVDVDGTLVDTNYHHAVAWFRAFRDVGITVPVWRIHRAIGMGGDRLVAAVTDDAVEEKHGDDLRATWEQRFEPMLDEIVALDGARELLVALRDLDYAVVLASSGKPEHIDHYLDMLDAKDIVDGWTTSADVESTKPAPDLLAVAMKKAPPVDDVVTIGDSVWDCAAAGRLGVPAVAVLTGGFGEAELTDAGAVSVHEDLPALMAYFRSRPDRA
jgi:HAD superfamily hydrolase (TIGR01549 family)